MPTLWLRQEGNHAHGCMPILLRVPELQDAATAQAGRLLRVLLLRLSQVPIDASARRQLRIGDVLEGIMEKIQMMFIKPLLFGITAFVLMLAIYFGVVSLISGMGFALEQFTKFWYFIVALALGFGIQAGLYTYLKNLVGQHGASGKVVAVSGTTSTAAMVSCCAHYLANILPIVGVTGILTIVAQYQVELFWIGLAFNAAGILYIVPKVIQATKEHKKC